jgi:hypothetical protein
VLAEFGDAVVAWQLAQCFLRSFSPHLRCADSRSKLLLMLAVGSYAKRAKFKNHPAWLGIFALAADGVLSLFRVAAEAANSREKPLEAYGECFGRNTYGRAC